MLAAEPPPGAHSPQSTRKKPKSHCKLPGSLTQIRRIHSETSPASPQQHRHRIAPASLKSAADEVLILILIVSAKWKTCASPRRRKSGRASRGHRGVGVRGELKRGRWAAGARWGGSDPAGSRTWIGGCNQYRRARAAPPGRPPRPRARLAPSRNDLSCPK